MRELREELGVEVRVKEQFESVTHAYPEKTVNLRFYFCEVVSGKPQPLGCAALKWVSKAELVNQSFPAADAQLLIRLESESQLWL
jgi:mutator protein MutT